MFYACCTFSYRGHYRLEWSVVTRSLMSISLSWMILVFFLQKFPHFVLSECLVFFAELAVVTRGHVYIPWLGDPRPVSVFLSVWMSCFPCRTGSGHSAPCRYPSAGWFWSCFSRSSRDSESMSSCSRTSSTPSFNSSSSLCCLTWPLDLDSLRSYKTRYGIRFICMLLYNIMVINYW